MINEKQILMWKMKLSLTNTEVLKSSLCDYNYAYILVRMDIK